MSEFINVQIGQCANQIGSSFWPLVLHEYGVNTNIYSKNNLKIHKDYIPVAGLVLDLEQPYNIF